MQAINLLISESAPVFYVLGLDREKIAAGLAAKYEKLLPYLSGKDPKKEPVGLPGPEFGYAFLERFIQIPFLLPQPTDEDVEKLLDSLGAAAAGGGAEQSDAPPVDPGLLVELSFDSPSRAGGGENGGTVVRVQSTPAEAVREPVPTACSDRKPNRPVRNPSRCDKSVEVGLKGLNESGARFVVWIADIVGELDPHRVANYVRHLSQEGDEYQQVGCRPAYPQQHLEQQRLPCRLCP